MFYLVRHGETAWNVAGLQASFTDVALTEHGHHQASQLKFYLEKKNFKEVWRSPLSRVRETCRLAGFERRAEIKTDLTEWNAGDYEGLKTSEISQKHRGWSMMTHGAPGGESPEQIEVRAGKVIKEMLEVNGDVLIFSSSHFLRALAGCFLGLGSRFGRQLPLSTAALSILAYDNQVPVIKLWNFDVLSLCDSSTSSFVTFP